MAPPRRSASRTEPVPLDSPLPDFEPPGRPLRVLVVNMLLGSDARARVFEVLDTVQAHAPIATLVVDDIYTSGAYVRTWAAEHGVELVVPRQPRTDRRGKVNDLDVRLIAQAMVVGVDLCIQMPEGWHRSLDLLAPEVVRWRPFKAPLPEPKRRGGWSGRSG